jgi:hypothetical protein
MNFGHYMTVGHDGQGRKTSFPEQIFLTFGEMHRRNHKIHLLSDGYSFMFSAHLSVPVDWQDVFIESNIN